ncbi:hypothetical protein AV530_016170 [Patagioenas fasciata monilis]|uniref:Uncharacterized protein n=1 Tax=Patagioenas fasciata monilis TaxID=372326 RepID=A0A1V4JWC1_PATFA|nr:hypothetical protein AV530_016170 [Patagioenas fasciata monilis]
MEVHAEARGCLKEAVIHGKPTLEQTSGRTCDHRLEQSVPEGLHPVEGTAGAVNEELQPVGGTHVSEVHGELSPVGGTPHWSRGRVRSPPPEEEGAEEIMCDKLTTTLIPCPPVLLVGRSIGLTRGDKTQEIWVFCLRRGSAELKVRTWVQACFLPLLGRTRIKGVRAVCEKVGLLHRRGYVVIGGACHQNTWFFKGMLHWMMCELTTRSWKVGSAQSNPFLAAGIMEVLDLVWKKYSDHGISTSTKLGGFVEKESLSCTAL